MTRKIKDKWRSKRWYKIVAPSIFKNVGLGETFTDEPEKLSRRTVVVTLNDLTGDFSKSHVKLKFKVTGSEGQNAYTEFIGHDMTSDYTRRMVRRRRSKIDGAYDVATRDGKLVRVKPMAVSDKRIQSSKKRLIRLTMHDHLKKYAAKTSFGDFVKAIIDGSLATDLFKACKPIYPLKKVEIRKSEVIGALDVPPMAEEEEKGKAPAKELVKSDKEDILKKFMEIPGVGESKANALYDGGFRSLGALSKIPVDELGKVDKVGPSLAHKIKEHLKTG